ncbi:MAG: phage tail assembly protein [Roseomonas sp.]|nr:phage tail assembly protein [Roseomonas sp.]MCA3299830.1 phage tail assembly protein [Roseomonas sp.]MCA3342574.1 phage tail assembly protein [Roseomonas sp.]
MRASIKITLKEPIVLRSAETGAEVHRISEVDFREPRAGDMAAAMDAGGAGGNGSMMLALASRCCGLTRAQVEDLSIEDFYALSEVASGFLQPGQGTGPNAAKSSGAPSGSLPGGSGGLPQNSGS